MDIWEGRAMDIWEDGWMDGQWRTCCCVAMLLGIKHSLLSVANTGLTLHNQNHKHRGGGGGERREGRHGGVAGREVALMSWL